jgi:hypothetical protein
MKTNHLPHPYEMRTTAIAAVFALLTLIGEARFMRVWTHADLAEASDTIAIIEATSTEKIDTTPPKEFPEKADNYQAWVTTFKVHGLLKGVNDVTKPMRVIHFTYSDKKNIIANGAYFMRFPIGPLKREVTIKYNGTVGGTIAEYDYRPTWLAYLKTRPDGTFEPSAGHYDAAPSFKELSDVGHH